MVVDLESSLGMSLVVDHLLLAVSICVRVPTFHVSMTVGHFVTLLRVLMIAGGEAELVAFRSMQTLESDWLAGLSRQTFQRNLTSTYLLVILSSLDVALD